MPLFSQNTRLTERSLALRDILRKIVISSFPFFISSFLVWFINGLNYAFMACFLDYTYIAAYGVMSAYILLAACPFIPMAVSISLTLEKTLKRGDPYEARAVVNTGLVMAAVFGVLSTLTAVILAPYYCRLVQTPPEIFDYAVSFLRRFTTTLVPILYFQTTTQILVVFKEFAGPVRSELCAAFFHAGFGFIFTGLFTWGIQGITVSAFLAQTAASVVNTYMVFQQLNKLGGKTSTRFSKTIAKHIFLQEREPAITYIMSGVFAIFVQFFVDTLGIEVIAAFTITLVFQDLLFLPINSLKSPARRFGMEYLEHRDKLKLGQQLNPLLLIAIIYGLLLLPVARLVGPWVLELLTHNELVVEAGRKLISVLAPYYGFYAISTLLSAVFDGLDRKKVSMWVTILAKYGLRFAILIPAAIFVQGLESITLAYPLSWAATALILCVYYYASYSPSNIPKK